MGRDAYQNSLEKFSKQNGSHSSPFQFQKELGVGVVTEQEENTEDKRICTTEKLPMLLCLHPVFQQLLR